MTAISYRCYAHRAPGPLQPCDGERYSLREVRYRCARCGGLLDVEHDLEALRQRPGAAWRALFDERAQRAPYPYASGVWGKKEWVFPDLAEDDVISLGEGWSPLVPMPRLARELELSALYIKQCGHSHTGSFKDLGMTALVSLVHSLRRGGARIPAVACASTGDTSAALAAYCARAGIPSLVFLPAGKITDEQLVQPLANGSLTLALDTDFDGCMALVARFCEAHGVYLANSMNPLRMEGQKTMPVELCQQLGWEAPDVLVVPGGNLGNVTAIGKGLRMMQELGVLRGPAPRLVVAQAEAANPLARAFRAAQSSLADPLQQPWPYQPITAAPTQASAIRIGAPVNVHKAMDTLRRFEGVVDDASEAEISAACALGDRHGLYTDPHTGVALAVLAKLRRRGIISAGQRVAVVSTAHGLKFGQQKRQSCQNRPVVLPPDLSTIEREVLPRLR